MWVKLHKLPKTSMVSKGQNRVTYRTTSLIAFSFSEQMKFIWQEERVGKLCGDGRVYDGLRDVSVVAEEEWRGDSSCYGAHEEVTGQPWLAVFTFHLV